MMMIFETITTTIFGAISVKAYLSKNEGGNDSKKLQKTFSLSGLNVKDGNQTYTTQLLKKKNYEWGSEYRYRIPQGRCFDDYLSKRRVIEAAINSRSVKVEVKDLRKLKFDRNIISNIKGIYTRKLTDRREVELIDDGVLKIRVYNEPLSENIEWTTDMVKTGSWAVPVGVNRDGVVYHDFDKSKHLIIAGVPGSGKSIIMKLITTVLTLQNPEHVSFTLIDLKGGPAFSRFKNMKQVNEVGINNEDALRLLKDVQVDMERVYQNVLVPKGFEDVKEAGIKKRHFIVIDEAADLADEKEAVEILTDIVRKGRGSGHYVIYATQYPTVQTVASQIKRNIPCRLTYVLDSSIASNAVLDGPGAEKLPEIPGRGIYKNVKQTTIQSPYISNKSIEEFIAPFNIDKGGLAQNEPKQKAPNQEARKHSFKLEKTRLS